MLKRIKNSLFLKIMILLGAFVIIPPLVIFTFVNERVTKELFQEYQNKLLTIVQEKQSKFSNVLANFENTTYSFANDNYANDYIDGLHRGEAPDANKLRRITAQLESVVKRENGILENIGYYYNGAVMADGNGKGIGSKSSDDREMLNIIKPSPTTGRPVLVNRVKLFNKRDWAFIAVELNNVTDKIVASGLDTMMKTVILDGSGLVIASEDQAQIMKFNFAQGDPGTAEFFKAMANKSCGVQDLIWNGQRYLAAFSKDNERQIYVISYVPVSIFAAKRKTLIMGIVLLLLFCTGLGLTLSFIFAKKMINAPLAKLMQMIGKMAEGDFTHNVMVDCQDEIGQMGMMLNRMNDSLSKLIGQALGTAHLVKNGANEIAQGNQDLAQRTQEQASTLEEVASTIEQIATAI